MQRWQLGSFSLVFNPSADDIDNTYDITNNYSLSGKQASSLYLEHPTREFSTVLFNRTGSCITQLTTLTGGYIDQDYFNQYIYVASGNKISRYSSYNFNYIQQYTISQVNKIYGIAIDNTTQPSNPFAYVYGDTGIFKFNSNNFSLLQSYASPQATGLCLTYNPDDGNLYTLGQESINQINFLSNTSIPFMYISTTSFSGLYLDNWNPYYFWYYDKINNMLAQYDLNGNAVSCIDMGELNVGNIYDISINRISNTITVITNNMVYIISPNQVNEQYYNLMNQLKSPLLSLTDELGRVMNTYSTEIKISEDTGHNINKPYYKLDIKMTICP